MERIPKIQGLIRTTCLQVYLMIDRTHRAYGLLSISLLEASHFKGQRMNNIRNCIMGGVMFVLAICGLFVASIAGQGFGYWGGIIFFVFAIWFIFRLIQVSFDNSEE